MNNLRTFFERRPRISAVLALVAIVFSALAATQVISPWFGIPGMALALNPFFVYQSSKMVQGALEADRLGQPLELQDQPLYSYVTLPAAINPAQGINFFGDAEATVGAQRTNLTRPNQVPNGTKFEMHGIRVIFAAPLTVLFTSYNTAIRDAFLTLTVGTSRRIQLHLRNFIQQTIIAPSFSAAAGDNPILTEQGYEAAKQLLFPILIQDQTNFGVNITFVTDVAALGSTVMGVQLEGILDRGNIKLDQSPTRSFSSLGV